MRKRISGVSVNAAISAEHRPVVDLAGNWALKLDPRNAGMAEGWASKPMESALALAVPGSVQSLDALAADYPPAKGLRNSYAGTFWLERTFDLHAAGQDRMIWLKLGGVAPAAHVWLNGSYVGYHCHAPVAVKWDVTDLAAVGHNRITVAVVEQDIGLLGGMRCGGLRWSALYRTVEVETTSAVHLEDVLIRPDVKGGKVVVSATVENGLDRDVLIQPRAAVATAGPTAQPVACEVGKSIAVKAGSSARIRLELDASGLALWRPDDPRLHTASVSIQAEGAVLDEVVQPFGMRTFQAVGSGLELNGRPFMARGAGCEFFSPLLRPLTDKGLIRRRWESLKSLGFNFIRCHTYAPTDEELAVADEVGLLIASEISLVSNFNKTEPFDEGLKVLREHIVQTRNHPSLGVYCLGNEGSQIMVKSGLECEHARQGYAAIKELAPDRPAMIAFGMQGELPDLPNDIESPHLWSDYFTWAYDGLTRVPWSLLPRTATSRPCIVHEYGKFGVWPDPREQALYPPAGYAEPIGDNARAALIAAGIEDKQDAIIANSRRLAHLCWRIAIEQARRQSGIDGYVMWTGFRNGSQNGGFVDDMGVKTDQPPDVYRLGANAPLAVLIDRDFDGRALLSGQREVVGVYLSNFSDLDVSSASIAWRLEEASPAGRSGSALAGGELAIDRFPVGVNGQAGEVAFIVPSAAVAMKLCLRVELRCGRKVLASNAWDFWAFPAARSAAGAVTGLIVSDFADTEMLRRFQSRYPQAVRPMDIDSMFRGCRQWAGMDLAGDFKAHPPAIVVADHWGQSVQLQLDRGGSVLLLDSGRFDQAWYPPPVTNNGPFDVNLSFASFRSGWDQGNIATVIEPSGLLGDFPHEGFCDVHFYRMVQYARPVRTQAVQKDGAVAGRRVIIRNVPKLKVAAGAEVIVQDPHAQAVQKTLKVQSIATDDRAYLLEAQAGPGRLIVCTLRMFDDPAGEYLLSRLLKGAAM